MDCYRRGAAASCTVTTLRRTSSVIAERRPSHSVTSTHSTDVTQVSHCQSGYQSTPHTVISSHGQVVTQSTRHKPALYKATGRGPKFSGHVYIKGHYQRAKFGCPRPLRGDSRGKCFSLTHPPFCCEIFDLFIFCSQQYGQQMEKNIGKLLVVL